MMHEGIRFDPDNVAETARYCRARNRLLQANTPDAASAGQALIDEVLRHNRERPAPSGELFPVFNAWCVIDGVDPRITGIIGTDKLPPAPQANFFVRLGRQPVLRDVNESDSNE